jgi:hypothetical protein
MRIPWAAVCIAAVLALGVAGAETKKADDPKKAEEDKKKAEEAKKKAEEQKKKAEEAQKKADDPKNWPARDFSSTQSADAAVCVYIKEADGKKKNPDAAYMEGKDVLGDEGLRQKLRKFNRIKIKNDGSDGKGWPQPWCQQAENGAILILFSGDMKIIRPFGSGASKTPAKAADVMKAADEILQHQAEVRKAIAEKNKEERAKIKAEMEKEQKEREVPGLSGKTPPKPKPKPGPKEPVDE